MNYHDSDFMLFRGNTMEASWNNELLVAFGKPAGEASIDEELELSDQTLPGLEVSAWSFGYIGYDYKNTIEQLESVNPLPIPARIFHFFEPAIVFKENEGKREVLVNTPDLDKAGIEALYQKVFFKSRGCTGNKKQIVLKERQTKESYLAQVRHIKEHIQRGDIYEMNFCMEFFSENVEVNPVALFSLLYDKAQAPFSAFCRFGDVYVISSSPERYLKKQGKRLLSQPIKGTRRRGKDSQEDRQLRDELFQDLKERAENIMIVDLVRNDLSRIAERGSVQVDELCGIYSFPQVHQMISSVSCNLRDEVSFRDIIHATFPMGSMTGAPKVNAMCLIDRYENTSRGLYSGALGYKTPEGDFDFSVLIRTILYDASRNYLSFSVGSAITAQSDPQLEYEECLVKAKALIEVLGARLEE
ncbi:MAG: anthranilate synthase component I family protein [Bacteroidia bacterium]